MPNKDLDTYVGRGWSAAKRVPVLLSAKAHTQTTLTQSNWPLRKIGNLSRLTQCKTYAAGSERSSTWANLHLRFKVYIRIYFSKAIHIFGRWLLIPRKAKWCCQKVSLLARLICQILECKNCLLNVPTYLSSFNQHALVTPSGWNLNLSYLFSSSKRKFR